MMTTRFANDRTESKMLGNLFDHILNLTSNSEYDLPYCHTFQLSKV